MNKKLIGIVGMVCLGAILAGCGQVLQSAASAQTKDETQSVAIETSAEEIDTGTESREISVSQVDSAPAAEPANEEVAVLQGQSENDETVAKKTQNIPLLEIPQLDHELAEGEYRWSQLLARDSIFPIYNPEFAPAEEAPYDDNELVIGLEINGEAKAYAIGPLNGREMVNDTLGGIPILVTW